MWNEWVLKTVSANGAFGRRKYFWERNFHRVEAQLYLVLLYSRFISVCPRLVQVKFSLQGRFLLTSVDSELCFFFFHSIIKYFGKRLRYEAAGRINLFRLCFACYFFFLQCCDKEYVTPGALKLYGKIQSLTLRFNEIIILVIFSLGCQSTFFFFFILKAS